MARKEKQKINYGRVTLELLTIFAEIGEDLFDCFIDQKEIQKKSEIVIPLLLDYLII